MSKRASEQGSKGSVPTYITTLGTYVRRGQATLDTYSTYEYITYADAPSTLIPYLSRLPTAIGKVLYPAT